MRNWIHLIIYIWILLFCTLPSVAQQMRVDEFVKLKKSIFHRGAFQTDKKMATLDLLTDEKGFTFSADGKTEVKAEEGDGMLTLKVPHKTKFIVIKHPTYGQLAWKVPVKKGLKKKHRYQGYLYTASPEKEYHIGKQWLVLYIQPKDAVVYIDSTLTAVRTGEAQFYLPVGCHRCRIEAPFYEAWEDTLCLTDSMRVERHTDLQPFYSYLSVKTGIPGSKILLDGKLMGHTEATSERLNAGRYRLTVIKDDMCYYDANVTLDSAEKKVVENVGQKWMPHSWKGELKRLAEFAGANDPTEIQLPAIQTQVKLLAKDGDTEILLNREVVGKGEWNGTLSEGLHAAQTRKDSLESEPFMFYVDSDMPLTFNLSAPQSAYGMLNVHSNVMDAAVLLDGKLIGKTPCVISNLAAGQRYELSVLKTGYKEVHRTVVPRGNDMLNVTVKMKKK